MGQSSRCGPGVWGRCSKVWARECAWSGLRPIPPTGCCLPSRRYFGFITKHPADHRFACHVFVSEESTKALAESVGYVCMCPTNQAQAQALEHIAVPSHYTVVIP